MHFLKNIDVCDMVNRNGKAAFRNLCLLPTMSFTLFKIPNAPTNGKNCQESHAIDFYFVHWTIRQIQPFKMSFWLLLASTSKINNTF